MTRDDVGQATDGHPGAGPGLAQRVLRSRPFWISAAIAALVGGYALFGFKVAPGILRSKAIEFVRQTYSRELSIGEVRLQPFKLQLEVRDVSLPDADGKPMLALRRLFVDLQLSSLWHRAFVFRTVQFEAPAVRAVIRAGGAMNLADLSPKADEPPEDAGELPRIIVESLVVADGVLDFLDLARERPFARRLTPVTFALKDFSTTPEGGDFQLTARTPAVEQLEWRGRLALAPTVTSQGSFSVRGLRAAGISEFLGRALPFDLSAGLVHVAGSYRLSHGAKTAFELALPRIELTGLALRARGVDDDWVQVPSLIVSDTKLALPERTVAIGNVALAGLQARAWIDPGGAVNLAQLFAPAAATAADTRSAANAADAGGDGAGGGTGRDSGAARPWQVTLAGIDVTDASIDFEDRLQAPVKRYAIAPVNARVSGVSLDLSRPLPVTMEATINGEAKLTLGGSLTPAPLAATLDVSLGELRMAMAQPYVTPVADLTIRGGTLGARGRLELAPPAQHGPQLSFAGDVTVDGFKSTDTALDQALVDVGRLQLQKLRYERSPDALSIDRVLLHDPYARVIVGRDRVLNIAAVLHPAGTAAAPAARNPPPVRTAAAEAPDGAATLPIRIREVRLEGGRLNFSDLNVQPNFSADVQNLRGTVSGLSSATDSRAKVDLRGDLGEFSPVLIAGEVRPFALDRMTDIGLKFENISLPVFNPYSGRFAGYNIAKGKLTTELHYLVRDRKLDASHRIRIDQLEWGEASGTKGEATLPVKFATVLLRDRHGVINLDVPVKGTLDDPKFRIGPIIWQIIKNIIVKAVTAPFALLGSLFAGAEEAQFVDFAPGSATLDAAAAARLATLARGLVEKPGLSLDIPIDATPGPDGPAIAERRYQEQLAAAMRMKLRRRADDETPLPPFETLEPKQQLGVLEMLVTRQQGSVPKLPEPPAPPEGTPRAEAAAMRDAAAIAYLEQVARAGIVPQPAEFDALGQERAAAVQHALLTDTGLEPGRVFMIRNGKVSAKDGKVRFELGLK